MRNCGVQYLELCTDCPGERSSSDSSGFCTLPRNFRLGGEKPAAVRTVPRQLTISNPGYQA